MTLAWNGFFVANTSSQSNFNNFLEILRLFCASIFKILPYFWKQATGDASSQLQNVMHEML